MIYSLKASPSLHSHLIVIIFLKFVVIFFFISILFVFKYMERPDETGSQAVTHLDYKLFIFNFD